MLWDKATTGGIFHAKQHQVEIFKNAYACKACPIKVKLTMEAYMNEKKNQKIELGRYLPEDDDVQKLRDEIQEEDDSMEEVNANGKRASNIRGKEVITKKSKFP